MTAFLTDHQSLISLGILGILFLGFVTEILPASAIAACGAVGFLLLVLIFFGFSGLLAYLLLAVYAQLQLLLSDYVQHYGLRRREIEGEDDVEPVAPWHSWNSSHWFSGGLMLNAPRHSDHHMHPARPYPELRGQVLELMANGGSYGEACNRVVDRLGEARALQLAGEMLIRWVTNGWIEAIA